MTLRRLKGLVAHLPPDGTALWRQARAKHVEGHGKALPPPPEFWTADRDLQASVIDLLQVLVWQNTEDSRHGRNVPKPIARPGVERGRKMGATSLPPAQVMAILARIGPQRDTSEGG